MTLAAATPDIIIWLGAICTLAIYSVLYRENPVFRFFEHLFIGAATGYGLYVTWAEWLYPSWYVPMIEQHRWYWIFALVGGSTFYFMYSKRYVWISRLAIGTFFGLGAGAAFKGIAAQYVPQIVSSFKPLVDRSNGHLFANHLIVFVTLVAVMSYFFFIIEHRHRPVAASAKAGRWLLMIAFGAIFGNTVMGRMSLFIDRLNFLLFEWLKLPKA
jgi:hypothetical protein